MTIQTHIDRALDRVRDEQTHVDEKQAAFDAFERSVRDISPVLQRTHGGPGQSADGGLVTVSASSLTPTAESGADRRREVRETFAETVRPYSIEDIDEPESLSKTISEELGDDVSVALAPETGGRFTPPVKRAALSAITERRQELAAMEQTLDAEKQSLRTADQLITEITDWLVQANETPLTDLGFNILQVQHETLADHRSRIDKVATDRQELLNATSCGATVGINHRTLTEYLYAEFPVDYPALVTVARLDGVCADCQRIIRDHLVRRI